MQSIDHYQKKFIAYLENFTTDKEPNSLYEPINYILSLGGKRLRPVLTLMTTEIFDGDYRSSLNAALAIEVFHNFSLIHDDIMDDAPLSGDAMLILAYQLFENYEPETFQALAKLFSKTALEVCEGQQYDIDFETRNDVIIPEYLKMIEYKTAVLVGAAMKMGAIIANASKEDQNKIYEFGKNLGIAFQLQDDYLDAFGDPKTFGKQVGGDIIENKKTYLYLKAIELSKLNKCKELMQLFSTTPDDNSEKIATAKKIFEKSGSADATKKAIEAYTKLAFNGLDSLSISKDKKALLKAFGTKLMNRTV